jgi:outer membrane protein assembly factor BamE (lipoprotein component of BamABCDE complex)
VRLTKLPLPFLACALLALPGCAIFSDAPHYRGDAVTQHDLGELIPGIATQADAQALLGPPSFVEQFDQNNWVYVAQVTRMRIGQTEGVKSQHIVVLTFNADGTLKTVTQRDTNDAVKVAMQGGQTPVPGGSPSFFQMLIGGVGSYNPLGTAQDTSAGPAASNANIGGAGGSSGGF